MFECPHIPLLCWFNPMLALNLDYLHLQLVDDTWFDIATQQTVTVTPSMMGFCTHMTQIDIAANINMHNGLWAGFDEAHEVGENGNEYT